MIRHVKDIDELVDLIDREFSGKNALCPICKHKLGTVGIPNIELGLPEYNFMEFKHAGVFCTQGHCIIAMEEKVKSPNHTFNVNAKDEYKLFIEDLGIKVFEVMKVIKPYLDVDEKIPNSTLYWMLIKKGIQTKSLSYDTAAELSQKLQDLGARVRIV